MDSKADMFFKQATRWNEELAYLRSLVLDSELSETFKWRNPCYTYKNTNVLIISSFKDFCAISFFKGVLINDTYNLLEAPGVNSQSVRLLQFYSVDEIVKKKQCIQEYVQQAISIEASGQKVVLKKTEAFDFPEELQQKFKEDLAFEKAFKALTPGRQRGYLLFFGGAKQAKTRIGRIEKYTSRILSGKGINDCTCGLSKRLPSCDGSHKYLNLKRPQN
tara:strand:+ start:300 stop:956 length:657 start_codon:yes stop_codon:yes gene_type:complete